MIRYICLNCAIAYAWRYPCSTATADSQIIGQGSNGGEEVETRGLEVR